MSEKEGKRWKMNQLDKSIIENSDRIIVHKNCDCRLSKDAKRIYLIYKEKKGNIIIWHPTEEFMKQCKITLPKQVLKVLKGG